jgi:hypothetical protein
VGDLETWVATFVIDEGVADSGSSPHLNSSQYLGAVLGGSLQFSGGYTSALDFSGYDVYVFNDASGVDAVWVTGSDAQFQVISDADPLSSLALPLSGTTIAPSPSITGPGYAQLSYFESIDRHVTYAANNTNNVSFSAGTPGVVPEPVSLVVWSVLAISITSIRRGQRP